MSYIFSRKQDFLAIQSVLSQDIILSYPDSMVILGDSLSMIKKIPNQSISLILTDPPYHATKKKNIQGDTSFKQDDDYLFWLNEYTKEWKRILKPNGTLYCFCDASMSAKIENLFSENFNILSNIVWTKPNEPGFDGWKGKMKKESLRQWYKHSERIIVAEPAMEGNLHRSSFAELLKQARKQSGLSGHQLTELVGAYGKVNHGGAVSNWETGRNIPSREQYQKIVMALLQTKKVATMPLYEDIIRPFFMDGSKEYTDIWTFPSVRAYKGKHPAEKPLDMLKHIIEASSYENDIVLDCFGGSGSTLLATLELNRLAISIEIDEQWANKIAEKLQLHQNLKGQKHQHNNLKTPQFHQDLFSMVV